MPSHLLGNEVGLANTIANVDGPLTTDQLRQLCGLALLSAHEHGATLEAFCDFVNTTTMLQRTVAQLESAAQMKHIMWKLDPERECPLLDNASEQLNNTHLSLRKHLADMVRLLAECREPGATVS